MAKPIVKKPAAKKVAPKRFQDAMSFLSSMESVAIAEDKNVSVAAATQKDVQVEVTGTVIPCAEVGASDKGVATTKPGPANGGGDGKAVTQEVGKVTVKETTDAGNAGEEDAVTNKTPDAVKAGEKDLTTGVISKEDNIEANEAEHIEPKEADDAVMNIDSAVEELENTGITAGSDQAMNRAETVANDLENINKVEVALEGYQRLLRGLRQDGKTPSRELTQAITICLESHDKAFFRPIVASLEHVGRPGSHLVAARGLEESIGGKLKELGKAAGNAVMRLIEMLIDVWNNFRRDTPKMITELDTVMKQIQGATLSAGEKVNIKGSARLMINGNFAGDSVEVVRNVEKTSRQLLVEWPNALIALVRKVDGQKDITPEAVEEAAQTAMEATFSQFTQVKSGDSPSNLESFDFVTRSPVMPGNKAMYIAMTDNKLQRVGIAHSKQFMRFEFTSIADRDSGEGEVSIPSSERAISSLKAVRDIVENLIGKDTSMGTLKELSKSLASDKGTPAGSLVRGAVQAALMQHRMFMGYLTSLVKAYIAFYKEIAGSSTSKEVALKGDNGMGKTNGKTTDRTKEADDDSVVSEQ